MLTTRMAPDSSPCGASPTARRRPRPRAGTPAASGLQSLRSTLSEEVRHVKSPAVRRPDARVQFRRGRQGHCRARQDRSRNDRDPAGDRQEGRGGDQGHITAWPAPVHVFVHGGYWHRMDKRDFSFVARGLVPAGAAVCTINYALIPTVDMDELVRQCRAAIVWVHANAASFGGDPDRITVSGHSAGGHLLAVAIATHWTALGAPADVLKAGCGISGLYDLEPIRLCYLNEILGLSPEAARRHSPVHGVPARAGPLSLAVGGLEGREYHRQTDDLAAAWRARGLVCDVLDLPGLHQDRKSTRLNSTH